MANIVWLPSMSVGIEKWDSDHRVLLELINRLDRALQDAAAGPGVVREAIASLAAYAEVHFEIEERVMAALKYPRLAAHQAEHEKMRQWIAVQRERAEIDDSDAVVRDLAEQLVHWLYTHVLTVDMQYSDFFDENRRRVEVLLRDYEGLRLTT